MKPKQIRPMSEEDIQSKIVELQKELLKHNAQIASGAQVKNPGQIKTTKKVIAKLKTILHEKKLGDKNK